MWAASLPAWPDGGDTLFLEPAGYIPFYAGIKTFDEVGLASPEILRFKERDPNDW